LSETNTISQKKKNEGVAPSKDTNTQDKCI